jgi:AcrR family transcriptional regulator
MSQPWAAPENDQLRGNGHIGSGPMPTKGDRQRARVYAEAMRAIAELGPEHVTMRVLGARLRMSPGHILYFFGSKDRLLLETLRWSEENWIRRETLKLDRIASPAERIDRLVEGYLPRTARDPRWLLWAHLYARPPRDPSDKELLVVLGQPWVDLLSGILVAGVEAGEFRPMDVPKVALRAYIWMDGLAISVLLGIRGYGPKWARAEAIEWLHEVTARDA